MANLNTHAHSISETARQLVREARDLSLGLDELAEAVAREWRRIPETN